MKDTLPQAWKRLTFAKASPTSAQPSLTSAPAMPSFRPNNGYTTKFLINSEGGLNNYIIHNEDHANAHLMIYCPNVYNQAAFNTWMDEKTFLLLDKSPEDIKEDMERQTPPVVRKHYKKLLDYNKPIPYGYIMTKRKKQWSKGRTIIAYSNTCVGRLLRVAALALQMLKATWPHHFGNIAAPQLWQEVHELLQANEEQPERELIFLNHDLVGFFNSIPQVDIIQSVRYLIAEFSKDNNDILLIDPHSKLNPISPILSTCAIVSTEITWLRLYGQHVASAHLADQLWIRRYVDNRAIIVDKEALHSNPYIWQLASLQFYKKPVQLEDENCDDFLGFRINANDRQVSYILHPQQWRYRLPQSAGSRKLRLSGYHSRRHMIESTVRSLAQQQLQAALAQPRIWFYRGQYVAFVLFVCCEPCPQLFDSDVDQQPVRLPLDDPPPCLPVSSHLEVEQVCQRHLSDGYIPMSLFPWLTQKLPSELLRASALTRRGAPTLVFSSGAYYHAGSVGIRSNTRKYPWTSALLAHMVRACTRTNFSTVSLLRNVNMAAHVDKYSQPGSTNVLVPLSPFRRGELWLLEDNGLEFDPLTKHATCPWKDASNDGYNGYNHSIRVKSMALADAHSLACDMAIQHTEITAYSLLEVTHDLRMLVHLAQTNKAAWLRCSQVLTSTSTECKIQSNAPWHKRAGRAVDGSHAETPIDIKMYLFNKRMHTWYHHELSYQQYMDLEVRDHVVSVAVLETMDAVAPTTPPSTSSSFDYSDEGGHDAAEQALTNATLLKTILKFHTELRVRMVAVSVEDTPLARHDNQAVQGAMDAIVQQHPQAHHTTVIRDYRPQHTLIEKLVSPDIVYSLVLTSIQERFSSAAEAETLHGKPILPASQADILSLRVGEYQYPNPPKLNSRSHSALTATASTNDMNRAGDVDNTEDATSWRYYWSKVNNQWQRVWFSVTRAWLFERERKDRNRALQQQQDLQQIQQRTDAEATGYASGGHFQFVFHYEEEEEKPHPIVWMSYATMWIHLAN
ncbi:unnamed protein product [Symbiodinium necroappetens]|uniref:Reverse transcriptase domain-containing protein n=1 Tax=Symbiodinium necroappetens TaxID=1628268 RepID=A0A812YYN8_9DINO|nr:unnamed protein product [Symbiodinium necroappetens]